MGASSKLKRILADGFASSGLSRLGLELQSRGLGPHVRALNYHEVPAAEASVFEAQLAYFSRHFVAVSFDDLLALAAGHWPHQRPGLLISFDDGLASHARVAAPLLERYGFIGWFMVPSGFVDAPPVEQHEWARVHSIAVRDLPRPDGRLAMSWEDLRTLAGRHVIGSHTVGHVRFSSDVSSGDLERETATARERLEAQLDIPVETFAWVGGEESSYSACGAEMIRKAGFRVGLMTNNQIFRPGGDLLKIQRTNVETSYSMPLTKLHLSGFYDILYGPKRRRVEQATALG